MRSKQWLRFGLASSIAAAAGLGATIIACSDDGAAGGGANALSAEAGTGETGTPDPNSPYNGTTDAGAKANANAKLTFVNAAADLGPSATGGSGGIFLCFRTGPAGAKTEDLKDVRLPPLPENDTGVPYGTGGILPSIGIDLEPLVILPIVINANSPTVKSLIQSGGRNYCDDLLKPKTDTMDGGGLEENKDYWFLKRIEAETFKKEKAYVVVLTGCAGDVQYSERTDWAGLKQGDCGPIPPESGIAGRGSLALKPIETERTPVSTTQIGIQFLHASTQFERTVNYVGNTYQGVKQGFMPRWQDDSKDGGAFQAATADESRAQLFTISPPLAIPEPSPNPDTFFVSVAQLPPPNYPRDFPFPPGYIFPTEQKYPAPALSVSAIGRLSAPPGSVATTLLERGKNYVFINVGNPNRRADPDGTGIFDTRSYHFLAFPTDPEVVPYKP